MVDDSNGTPRYSDERSLSSSDEYDKDDGQQQDLDETDDGVEPTRLDHLLTAMSIMNFMLGLATFSMPWAMNKAGLILSVMLQLFMGGLVGYSCYRVVMHQHDASKLFKKNCPM